MGSSRRSPTCTTSPTRSASTSASASAIATRRSCSALRAACARARSSSATSSFLVISGDALTDIDLSALAARHRESGGIATLAVKQVPDTREFGVVLHDRDGRITGFQEKPAPEEALSDLGNCGIYVFEPADLRLFPRAPVRRLGQRRVPGAARQTTCRSTSTRCASTGTTSARWASCVRARSTRCAASCGLEVEGEELGPGRRRRRRARAARRTPRSKGRLDRRGTCGSARACV